LLDRRPAVRDWLDRMQRRPSYAVSPMKPAFELMRGSKRPEIRLWSEPVGL
jgi:glutathione S-transferase